MTVQLCLTSLIVQLAIIVHQVQEFRSLALKANSPIHQRTQNLQIAEIVPLANTALVQEILLQQRNVLLIITAQVDKVHQHQENTCAHQVTFAKLGQPSQSGVKMEPSKVSLAKVSVRRAQKVTTVTLPIPLLLMQHYVLVVIIARVGLGTIVTSHAQNVSTLLIPCCFGLFFVFVLFFFCFFFLIPCYALRMLTDSLT